jgi:hypothetical protein
MRNNPTFLHQVLEFSGSPYEIGFQRGKMFTDHTKRALEEQLNVKGKDYNLDYLREKYPDLHNKWENAFEKTPNWFRDEWKGHADGAGVPFEELIITSDLFPFSLPQRHNVGPYGDDCNGFIAHGQATVDGKPIIGGNGETHHEAIRYMSMVRIKNKEGNNFVMQTKRPWFMSGQAGINEKGVCIFGSGVSIKQEEMGDLGYGYGAHTRLVLQEANNVDEAIDLTKEGPRRAASGSHKYIADKKRAAHIEETGKHVEVIDPESGFSAGASPYFSSPKMTTFCDVIVDETDPRFTQQRAKKRGVFRMERYHELFQQKKPLKIEDIPSILGDHGGRGTGIIQENIEGACLQGSDYTICVHGGRMKGGEASNWSLRAPGSFHASAFSNISQPEKLTIYVAFGSPCEAGYVPFKPPT